MIQSRLQAFALAFIVAVIADFAIGFVVDSVAATVISAASFAIVYVFLRRERSSA